MKLIRLAVIGVMAIAALSLAGCVMVGDNKPTASFTYEVSGLTVTFDAGSSRDEVGEIDAYEWNFGEGEDNDGDGEVAINTYSKEGTYLVTLTVTNNQTLSLSDKTTQAVTINVTPKTDPIAKIAAERIVSIGTPVVFNGGRSNDPDGGDIIYGYWDFGDDKVDSKIEGEWKVGYSPVIYVTHTYIQTGSFVVSLLVKDDEGSFGRITREITVE